MSPVNSIFLSTPIRLRVGLGVAMLFACFSSFGQKEANNWFMSPAVGMTFKSGTPKKLEYQYPVDTRIRSVISDADGNLLFYTNGIKVWDRSHHEMPHGNGLLGSPYQSEIQIAPKPGDPSRYYIFTTHGSYNWGVPDDAARFSEVDLCLNNGLGDVIEETKNTPLVSIAASRAAVVKHSNGIDYWVAFHKWQSDAFYCYKITANGVNPLAVVTHTGHSLGLSYNSTGDGGEMKFSPDGKKLAMVVSQVATVEVYDFNAQTGTLSNRIVIPAMYRQNYQTPDYTFGAEFSPNGEMLYVTRTNACLLTQYDLSAGDNTAIVKSRTILAGDTLQHLSGDFYTLYGLQLGNDGKLYAAWSGFQENTAGISVISKPNEKGHASLYRHNIMQWTWPADNSGISPNYFASFPTFAANYFEDRPTIQNDFNCITPSVKFWLDFAYTKSAEDIAQIQWNFGDPTSGNDNTSTEINPAHTFLTAGNRSVNCLITWQDGTSQQLSQTLAVSALVVQGELRGLGKDTTLCQGATLKLDASNFEGTVSWHDGSTKDYFNVTAPGTYWFNACMSGCSVTDSISIDYFDATNILGNDTTHCEPILRLEADIDGNVTWQNGATTNYFDVTGPGTYWVEIQKHGCTITDSITVKWCDAQVFIPNIVTPNGDDKNDFFEVNGIENEAFSLTIYNRNGTLVYQADSYRNDWDGSDLSSGVYFYRLRHNTTTQSFKGWIEIAR